MRHAAKSLLSAVGFGHSKVVQDLSAFASGRPEEWLRQEAIEALSHLAQRGDAEARSARFEPPEHGGKRRKPFVIFM